MGFVLQATDRRRFALILYNAVLAVRKFRVSSCALGSCGHVACGSVVVSKAVHWLTHFFNDLKKD